MKFLHDPLRRVAKREIKSCCGCKRFQAPALTSPPITGHERRTVTRFSCWTTYFVAVKSQPSAMLGRPIRATGWPLQTCILQNDISYPILSNSLSSLNPAYFLFQPFNRIPELSGDNQPERTRFSTCCGCELEKCKCYQLRGRVATLELDFSRLDNS